MTRSDECGEEVSGSEFILDARGCGHAPTVLDPSTSKDMQQDCRCFEHSAGMNMRVFTVGSATSLGRQQFSRVRDYEFKRHAAIF